MRRLFADAAYLIARLNPRDQFHQRATHFETKGSLIFSSDMVLTEALNSLAKTIHRRAAAEFALGWLQSRSVQIIHHNEFMHEAAVLFYLDRPDKNWSLTDCASFLIMDRLAIDDALTADRHFEQAGYRALLLP